MLFVGLSVLFHFVWLFHPYEGGYIGGCVICARCVVFCFVVVVLS